MRSKHKYGAVRTEVDGIAFASKAEARRYQELKLLQKAGEIEGLELQPKFPLIVEGKRVGAYIADFRYWLPSKSRAIIEDVKGMRTAVYRMKKKIVEAQYGITITEITR